MNTIPNPMPKPLTPPHTTNAQASAITPKTMSPMPKTTPPRPTASPARRPALLAALLALALTTLAPAVAQQATIDLGTHSGINFTLIRPITLNDHTTATTDDKLYYHLDHDEDGTADAGDRVMHDTLDTLLNGGSGTTDTQPGNHDGSDDVRSVIIGRHALILPTTAEMRPVRRPEQPAAARLARRHGRLLDIDPRRYRSV